MCDPTSEDKTIEPIIVKEAVEEYSEDGPLSSDMSDSFFHSLLPLRYISEKEETSEYNLELDEKMDFLRRLQLSLDEEKFYNTSLMGVCI